jgi:hypothetical protein
MTLVSAGGSGHACDLLATMAWRQYFCVKETVEADEFGLGTSDAICSLSSGHASYMADLPITRSDGDRVPESAGINV